MNVLIISSNRNALPFPVMPVGACIVADALRARGHRVRFLDLMFEADPAGAVRKELAFCPPEVIGLSVRNIDNNDMQSPSVSVRELAGLVKVIRAKSRAPLVLGGAAISVMPGEILRFTGADCAVVGEGERVFPEVVSRMEKGLPFFDIPGVARIEDGAFINSACPGPGSLPEACTAPDFSRWINRHRYTAGSATAPLQTKLGCHFRCVYCTYRKIEGGSYRLFEPESAADAVRRYVASGLRDIEFVDSVFNSPKGHAVSVCESVGRAFEGKRGASRPRLQTLELNPLFADDELFRALRYAGFSGVGITAESASDAVLDGLGKGFYAPDVYRAAETVRKHDIPCLWIFMLGGPGETRVTVMETLEFARRYVRREDIAFFTAGIRIYPGTELEGIARAQGLLSLSAPEMLEPVFYMSPQVGFRWVLGQVNRAMQENMNFINSDSIGLPLLSRINRMGHRFGIRPPLWKYARRIRRGFRMVGMRV